MKCPNCGSEIENGSDFCENCGMIIAEDTADAPSFEQKPKKEKKSRKEKIDEFSVDIKPDENEPVDLPPVFVPDDDQIMGDFSDDDVTDEELAEISQQKPKKKRKSRKEKKAEKALDAKDVDETEPYVPPVIADDEALSVDEADDVTDEELVEVNDDDLYIKPKKSKKGVVAAVLIVVILVAAVVVAFSTGKIKLPQKEQQSSVTSATEVTKSDDKNAQKQPSKKDESKTDKSNESSTQTTKDESKTKPVSTSQTKATQKATAKAPTNTKAPTKVAAKTTTKAQTKQTQKAKKDALPHSSVPLNELTGASKPSKTLKETYTTYVTTGALWMRQSPSLNSQKLIPLSLGADVVVHAKKGDFLYVYSNRYKVYGWVLAEYTSKTRPVSSETVTVPGLVKPDKTKKATTKTVTAKESLYLRKGPGKSYEKIRLIPYGYQVSVIGESNKTSEFVYVKDLTSGICGWVTAKYLK